MKILILLCGILCFSCASNKQIIEETIQIPPAVPVDPEPITPIQKSLNLTFAGDIMAHNVNFNMKNYDIIYDDVRELLQADDVSFANLEVPVCDDLPYETYPMKNSKSYDFIQENLANATASTTVEKTATGKAIPNF